ncbi:MAG: SDR family oxidoreductase [Bacteroidota bacterium]
MKISILGCGWLGMALGRKLAQNTEYEVKGSTTGTIKLETIKTAGMQAFRVDLGDHCPDAFFESDILIITIPPSTEGFEKNMSNLVHLLPVYKIEKVVFISTTSLYPSLNQEVLEEDADYLKSPHSGISMLAIEDLFRESAEFQTTIIRFAGLYGPGREPGRFLAARSGLKGAENPINLIHQDDCIAIIENIIGQGVWGETFNACSDEHPTRKEFYTRAAESLGLGAPGFSNQPTSYKVVNSDKLKSIIGYKFIHPDAMKDL